MICVSGVDFTTLLENVANDSVAWLRWQLICWPLDHLLGLLGNVCGLICSGHDRCAVHWHHEAPGMTGWWYTYPSEKYEFVSWDDYSKHMESHKIHIPNHQPDEYEHIYIYIYIHDWTENTHAHDYLHKLNAIIVGGSPLATQKPSMYGKVLNIYPLVMSK